MFFRFSRGRHRRNRSRSADDGLPTSIASRRVSGTPKVRRKLSVWPLPRPRSWLPYVSQPQSEAEWVTIRRSVERRQPQRRRRFGSRHRRAAGPRINHLYARPPQRRRCAYEKWNRRLRALWCRRPACSAVLGQALSQSDGAVARPQPRRGFAGKMRRTSVSFGLPSRPGGAATAVAPAFSSPSGLSRASRATVVRGHGTARAGVARLKHGCRELRPRVSAFALDECMDTARPSPEHWAEMLSSRRADGFKEQDVFPVFLTDCFCGVLG